tara:strand:- start:6620 stop:7582 length:963 start_codon:yes stop_codon:yes gene_type:complete
LNFCTHFDKNYIPHGLTLLESLKNTTEDFLLHITCMDNYTFDYLSKINLTNVKLYKIQDVESNIKGLSQAKISRNNVEYFFTCSPATCKNILIKNPNINSITYLDSDLYFFSSPKVIFDEIKNSSIAIIEHKFHWITKRQIKYGRFNVGWVNFKNDHEGNSCLDLWLKDCLNWCYQKVEENRFGDQKYLDKWPKLFKNLKIIENIGANAAIWNVKNYNWSFRDNKIYINKTQLVFYHFANIYQIDKYRFNTNLSRVLMPLNGVLKENVYKVYLKNLQKNFDSELIFYKKDNHLIGIKKLLFPIYRKICSFIFKDIIDIRL